jgi:hypothetical protein
MTTIVTIDAPRHRSLRVDRTPSPNLGDARRFVQIAVPEFPALAGQTPILISKESDTGAFICGAMFGFDENENLFLGHDGRWGGYRPLNLEREPFVVLNGELAIDMDSPRVNAPGGELLFDAEGQPTACLQRGKAALEALRPGLAATRAFLSDLVGMRLLTPLEVELSFDDGSELRLEELYTVQPATLRQLGDAQVLELFRKGHLYLLDLMILSMQQLPKLAERKNRRLAGLDQPAGAFPF